MLPGSVRLTRRVLVERVAMRLRLRKALCERVVNAVFEEIAATLVASGQVRLSRFGTFFVRVRASRPVPSSGGTRQVGAQKQAVWRPSDQLRARLNGKSGVGDRK